MSYAPAPTGTPPVHAATPSAGRRIAVIARRLLPIFLFVAIAAGLILALGVAQRFGWITVADGSGRDHAGEAGEIYTCPMHPQIRQPSPGRCPICGMELVQAAGAGADLDELSVKIEPAQRRLANIQTAEVKRAPLEATLQTLGAIAVDESRQATIAAYIAGRLERLFADYTGVAIKKGDHLAVIYSPQLHAAQVDYVEARRALRSAGGMPAVRQAQEALVANTRQRLREFGVTDQQLAELDKTGTAEARLTIYAPQGGTVVEKLAIEGNYVSAGDPIYRIADLSMVWLMLELFPEDASRIRFGQRVEAVVQSLPGQTLMGRVAFIDPTVNPQTRTVGVRVELSNEGGLRPGDYAKATIAMPIGPQGKVFDADLAGKWISPMHPQIVRDAPGQCPVCGMDLVPTSQYGFAEQPVPQPESLYVPRSAVLLAGGNSVIYVETEPGRFQIRPVKVGPILRDKIVIIDGLRAGEKVATAGNFLIDSQMQLAGNPSLIDPARAIAKRQQRTRPLTFEQIAVTQLTGATGERIEGLYAAYFQVQQALADDQTPPAAAAQSLHNTASQLRDDSALPEPSARLVQEIADRSDHLHHMNIKAAREAFKPISDSVIALATQLRGDGAEASFTHFYCPMVPGGGGDWLQSGGQLLNPYFGSQMLRCGEQIQVIPSEGEPSSQGGTPPRPDPAGRGNADQPKGEA